MLMSTSCKTKAAVNLEALLVYPHALCIPGGAPRKCVKSKLYDATLKNLYLMANNYPEKRYYIHIS